MNESLEKFAFNLSREKFKIILQFYTSNLDLLLPKGIYPYEYVADVSKLTKENYPHANIFKTHS